MKIFYLINDIFKLQNSNTNETILASETVISNTDVKLVEVKLFFWRGVESTKLKKSF